MKIWIIYDVLRDLVSFVQLKKRENTHGGVLLLVKLQVFSFLASVIHILQIFDLLLSKARDNVCSI